MMQRPANFSPEYASAFAERSVVEAYQHRPEYPSQVFEVLRDLIVDAPRRALDVGCGTGFIARPLVEHTEALDAVDVSQPMIEMGKCLPNGDHPGLHWIVGRAEDAPLNPPYALITAGDSLHWMDWDVVMPRFADALSPNGQLAILTVNALPNPWDEALQPIMRQLSVYGDRFERMDLIAELERRRLFEKRGELRSEPTPCTQSLDAYVESFHGRAGFPRERMSFEAARDFDDAVREAASAFVQSDAVALHISARITWGMPLTTS